MVEGVRGVWQFSQKLKKINLNTHASSAAFYIFLSLVPMLVVICTIIPYTPISQESLLGFVLEVFPAKVENIVVDIIDDVYERSAGVLSAAILVTLWSAGKGIMAVRRGLNAVNQVEEQRNYFVMRIISSFYTLVLLVMILLSMIILVFGNVLVEMMLIRVPKLQALFSVLLNFRFLFVWVVLTLILAAFYAYLPDKKQKFISQLSGASFGAAIWSIFSWGFSIYVSYGKPYSIYGSLSIIAITMMWLYICIYIIFVGAYINRYLEEREDSKEITVL